MFQGIAIAACGEDGEPLLRFFESVSIVMMKITTWIIHLAPIGVCFLVAQQLIEKSDLAEEFRKLGWYFLTVLLGLGIHEAIIAERFSKRRRISSFSRPKQRFHKKVQIEAGGKGATDARGEN